MGGARRVTQDQIVLDAGGAYRIADVDLGEPLEPIRLEPGEAGVAIVVRRGGRPLGFGARAVTRGMVEPGELGRLVAEAAAKQILREQIADELDALHGDAAAPEPPSVTLAVCTRDRPDDLARCLDAALAVRDEAGTALRIMVVDNAPSDDRTASLVASRSGVDYVHEPKPGLDFARNRALSESSSEFVAFVDDDAVVDRGWFGGFAAALRSNPDAAAVTGQVLPYSLDTQAQALFEARGGFRRGFAPVRYKGQRHISNRFYPCAAGIFGAGCNMVLRRSTILKLGGFDEALDTGPPLPGGGDLDIFYRVIRAGHPLVYEPRLLVFHEHRREYAALRRQYWTWGEGLMAFVTKSHAADPGMRARLRRMTAWWFQHQLHELVASARGRSRHPPDLVAAQIAGALAGLGGTYRRSARRSERIRREHG